MVGTLQYFLVRFRLPLILALNLLLFTASYVLALALRFDFAASEMFWIWRLYLPLSLLMTFRSGAYIFFGLNRGYWRYTSTDDLTEILKAHTISTLLFASSVLLLRIPHFPRSVIIMEFALSLLIAGGSRLIVRLFCERVLSKGFNGVGALTREIIVLGAGNSGHLLIKTLRSQPRLSYEVVGVLDDHDRLQEYSVYGARVIGKLSDLDSVLSRSPHVAAVMLAIPSISKVRIDELQATCDRHHVPLKRLQSFEDIACVDAGEAPQTWSVESLLQKEVNIEHEQEIRQAIRGKRVLVTGAGGSIGSELVRQILPFEPESLVMYDHSEYNLYRINREIRTLVPEVRKRAVLGSILDVHRLERLLREEQPHFIFHAAAYKHVPLIEENPYQAILNNVLGTRNVLRLAFDLGIDRFVLISTDKAVAPVSIMGASKRIAEMLVQNFAYLSSQRAVQGKRPLSTSIVRFGNVINSAGSVIPLFKEQILSGGPVTVTHPHMERFFMSIREAVRLVLTAGALGELGVMYVLDMGKQIRVLEVAKKMLAAYGRRDIEIVFTGIRPGEKLTEELIDAHEVKSATRLRKVHQVVNSAVPNVHVLEWVNQVESRLPGMSDSEIVRELSQVLSFGSTTFRAAPSEEPERQIAV